MIRPIALAISVLLGIAATMRAQQTPCLERTIPVSIAANDLSTRLQLTAVNIKGWLGGKEIGIKSLEISARLPRVILLVDTSGSLRPRRSATIDAAEGVLSKLPASVEAGLAFFAKDTVPVVLPGADRSKILLQLEALRRDRQSYRGKTALWSSVLASAKMLPGPAFGDVVYVVSDGGENASEAKDKDVERTLVALGVRLFGLVLTTKDAEAIHGAIAPLEPGDARNFDRIARLTGGTAVLISLPELGFPGKFTSLDSDRIAARTGPPLDQQIPRLLHFYRLELTVPYAVTKPVALRLELAHLDKEQINKLELGYPAALPPCP